MWVSGSGEPSSILIVSRSCFLRRIIGGIVDASQKLCHQAFCWTFGTILGSKHWGVDSLPGQAS